MSTATAAKKLHVTIARYCPDKDHAYFSEHDVDTSEIRGQMMLDVLELIKRDDPTLALRRSCREGVCGSDGMNINGKNRLACVTPWRDMGTRIMVRPLSGMPIKKDLIVDMSDFFKQLESVKPYLVTDKKQEPGAQPQELIQTEAERSKIDGLYECILCACCTSSCPSYWWNRNRSEDEGDFIGPAAALAAARFILDSRDEIQEWRLQNLYDNVRLFRCRSIMNCADVCPKGLNPTEAIGQVRQLMTKKSFNLSSEESVKNHDE